MPNGQLSSPDITMALESITGKIQDWHTPIKMEVNLQYQDTKTTPRWVWNCKSGDIDGFTQEVEHMVNNITRSNVNKMEQQLRTTILKDAYSKIGMKKVGNRNQEWLTNEIREFIYEIDTIRRTDNQK